MKKKLPFTIGEQYEVNEFNLQPIKELTIGNYTYIVYKYIKSDLNTFFDFKVYAIKLFYNADILSKVVICFRGNVAIEIGAYKPSERNTKSEIYYLPIQDITIFEYFADYF